MTAEQICSKVDPRIRKETMALASQVIFMAKKLKQTQKLLTKEQLTVEYDNGGGQTGIRENPAFSAYEKMMTTYTKSLTTLVGIIGQEAAENINTLVDLRKKFKVVGQ